MKLKEVKIKLYNMFASVTNIILTLGIIVVAIICIFIGSLFKDHNTIDAIVTVYNQETKEAYIEYSYKNDTKTGKFYSGQSLPVGQLIKIKVDKKNSSIFTVIDTNMITNNSNNKLISFGTIALLLLFLYKMIYGPFVKRKKLNDTNNIENSAKN